ncbi:twin-arginine translocase TatA/TatE family subunit [Vulgatibacter incomptus]|uniref:Sec-independent protein translocase protein TatA n=1 Tax=Vulgatibacter incomptus TaxID=1391653 RepID=A0A0K1P9Q7_9BACT|nr:twin-arginine translocase TatA/TatE family subunit [Vulgatibacter incomptus]AKU90263.1 Twin-arginine translocation protein TatA [Vulgatibacter incomptus]
MFGFKPGELLIIFALILILFGGTRLPGLGKALGSGIRNFKKGLSGDETEDEESSPSTASKPKA